ncbi:conserved hypothetical protein, partial [Ixodes scapularis]
FFFQQPSWRLWGEEKNDGAVYTVYLKKVRYHPSSSLSRSVRSPGPNWGGRVWCTGVHDRYRSACIVIRAEQVLHLLTAPNADVLFGRGILPVPVFGNPPLYLLSLQLECNPQSFHATGVPSPHRALVQALLVWLDMYPEDLYEPPQFVVLRQLLGFAQCQLDPGSSLELRAKHRLQQFLARDPEKGEGPPRLGLFFEPPPWGVVFGPRWPPAQARAQSTPGPVWLQELQEEHAACQLTWMDAELFRRLVPHHCLGAMWRRRGGNARDWAATVHNTATATVRQFNAVSRRVTSTVLWEGWRGDAASRARVLAKWVGIAQELRFLKNFSSLKAIIAALQSNDIYRLSRVWALVEPDRVQAFLELARIFSSEEHQMSCKELMLKEGTAKFADTVGDNDRQLQKAMQKQLASGTGTVPYLGIFLRDLTVLDAALPDVLPGGLLNFDKRRREFRILAQVKLLQSAANCYSLEPDPSFVAWFDALPILSDDERYTLPAPWWVNEYVQLPVVMPGGASQLPKEESMQNTQASGAFFLECCEEDDSTNFQVTTDIKCWKRDITNVRRALSEAKTELELDSASLASSGGQSCDRGGHRESLPRNGRLQQRAWQSTGSLLSALSLQRSPGRGMMSQCPPPAPAGAPDLKVIRVSVEQPQEATASGLNLYKSILLSNGDHTPAVVRHALDKHGLEGDPDEFVLAQQLPDSEIVFPASANVFYALSNAHALNFVLRPKKAESASPALGAKKLRRPFQFKKRLLPTTSP